MSGRQVTLGRGLPVEESKTYLLLYVCLYWTYKHISHAIIWTIVRAVQFIWKLRLALAMLALSPQAMLFVPKLSYIAPSLASSYPLAQHLDFSPALIACPLPIRTHLPRFPHPHQHAPTGIPIAGRRKAVPKQPDYPSYSDLAPRKHNCRAILALPKGLSQFLQTWALSLLQHHHVDREKPDKVPCYDISI